MYDKIILVTGGAGFIGSNYLNAMVPHYPQYQFLNVDALTYAANLAHIHVAEAPNYRFIRADIRNCGQMQDIFSEYAPTHIIHFAAESHVDNSIEKPHVFIDTNITGTHVLLALARAHSVKRFHHISTDEVYGSLQSDSPPVDEQAPLAPNSPYSASKAAADLLARAYHRTYNLDVVITRSSNNYGPHQHVEKLIPRFVTQLMQNKKVPLYARGLNVRDWIYVGDNVQGIDRVFHAGTAGEIYNIGGDAEFRNIEITRMLLELRDVGEEMIEYVADRPGHDFRYAMNSQKIRDGLGWKPRTSLREGLRATWNFYAALLSQEPVSPAGHSTSPSQ